MMLRRDGRWFREKGQRRAELLSLLASSLTATAQERYDLKMPVRRDPARPNGTSQKDVIAKQNHEKTLKDALDLVSAAKELQDDLKKAGSYVVPVEAIEKTQQIEKLARRIRERLKA